MGKSITLKFVVIGSGDTSVGIFPSHQNVSVTFEDNDETTLDVEAANQMLCETFRELLENGRTICMPEEKFNAAYPPKTYAIFRHYKSGKEKVLVRSGLSLEDAREHCRDPETSSRTAWEKEGKEHTALYGEWFDGFEEEME